MHSAQASEFRPEWVGSSASNKLSVRVRSVTWLAEDILSFELVDPDRKALPPFSAGSHIDVHLPGGLIRQYSLCNDPSETHRYVFAALRDRNGRGGSVAVHALSAGSRITVSRPRNRFALAEKVTAHVFAAGGIGITPIMSMVTSAMARGEPFHLYYCTRSLERTAFLDELKPLIASGRVTLHHDDGDPARSFDFQQVLARQQPGAHLYYCGPSGFMSAVEGACLHWLPESVHCERFNAPPPQAVASEGESESAFDVKLARTGEVFTIPTGRTIVEVLHENGIDIDVSCQEGYCGTCMTRYLEGEPLHRDTVLDEEDRKEFVMVCCARSREGCLVLDI